MPMTSACPGCAHEEACGHADVTHCANREPIEGREGSPEAAIPGTPGCSCNGLRDAIAARDRYRAKALRLACLRRFALYNPPLADCIACLLCDDQYCDAVLMEVDG